MEVGKLLKQACMTWFRNLSDGLAAVISIFTMFCIQFVPESILAIGLTNVLILDVKKLLLSCLTFR